MNKTPSIKNLAIPALMFILGFGLIAGCSNKKSDQANENNVETSDENAAANNETQSWTFTATLEGSSEVPPVTSDATGDATITLNDDNSIMVEGEFSGLSSAFAGAHIHMAVKGENGGVIQPLSPTIGDDKMSGSFDSSYELNEEQVEALKAGEMYINVHSDDHKSGEIRGQLTASDSDTEEDSY